MKTTKTLPRLDASEHAARALPLIGRFVWLRATELGRFMYPRDAHARKYAEKHLRKLLALGMVIARPLPGKDAGTAYVLGKRGVQFLHDEMGLDGFHSGKYWGTKKPGIWIAPTTWQHDLIATGVLAWFCEHQPSVQTIYPEHVLRHLEPEAKKHPDGLIVMNNGKVPFTYWLEVENSRKSGRNLDALVSAVIKAGRGTPVTVYDFVRHAPVKRGLVAIKEMAHSRDERGYRLDHLARIESTLGKFKLAAPIDITIAWVTMRGVGVGDVRLEVKTYRPQ